jgi:high-affinity iron transporter
MLLLYNIVIIQKQNKYSDNNAENNNIDYKLTSANLFLVPFLTVFREGMEIVLFLLPIVYKSPLNIIIGALGGILISILIVLLVYKTTIKLSINLLFSLLTLFLIIIGAIMFGEGIMKLLSPETSSLKTAGAMVYGIPLAFLFLKRETKKYIKN